MSTPDASEAARQLNRARWGTRTLDTAHREVISRMSELTTEQRAELLAAVGGDGDADGGR